MANRITHSTGSFLLSDYAVQIADTDVLDPSDVSPILQGLYGEVGGIMSTAKKHIREKSAYPGFKRAAEEEFGDTLWYLAALCRRLNIPLDELFAEAASGERFKTIGAASDMVEGAFAHVAMPTSMDTVDSTLFRFGRSAAALLEIMPDRSKIVSFARDYLDALHATKLVFADVARGNLRKARGAFIAPRPEDLVDFDAEFGVEEQLPRNFRIRINQRGSGRSYLQWNSVFIGDPLTDNIADPDGYRFHDVFHFAYCAILHWSPVMRALIKHKRKSKPDYDEVQDGGRAIVVEEGVTAWIFARAKELNFFEGQDRVSLGMLKTIGEFVDGYEVSQCPLKLWEQAILEGYAVFCQIRAAEGGWVVGDRARRTIRYEPLESIE
ncbi:nucleoside triphosphate pyrophosphohydrolase family protein [Methylosinus sp. LW3]|uniref:nucleoside triphosphate pyrophosphohydrolase family protein n=1 Tax=Methylosinus sp. LW3 TaxID=107635 RepID=UPI00046349DB|nr:nucleoside triphosphate pyrophosphohydrolase family protein [Methylosinus sp. LW3]